MDEDLQGGALMIERIEDYIPAGHENAISRRDLRTITHLHDRELRQMIAVSLEPIYNVGKGYFRYKDESDLPVIKAYLKQETRRNMAICNKVVKIRKAINEIERGNVWLNEGCSPKQS